MNEPYSNSSTDEPAVVEPEQPETTPADPTGGAPDTAPDLGDAE